MNKDNLSMDVPLVDGWTSQALKKISMLVNSGMRCSEFIFEREGEDAKAHVDMHGRVIWEFKNDGIEVKKLKGRLIEEVRAHDHTLLVADTAFANMEKLEKRIDDLESIIKKRK